jgi:hypothetical protein
MIFLVFPLVWVVNQSSAVYLVTIWWLSMSGHFMTRVSQFFISSAEDNLVD